MSDVYNQSPAMMSARGQVAKGQTYGKRKQQEEAMRAVPMAPSPTGTAPVTRPQPAAPGSLTAPTTRPNEPITAGAPFGAGPGPRASGIPIAPSAADQAVRELRLIAQQFRSDELLDLLDSYEIQA